VPDSKLIANASAWTDSLPSRAREFETARRLPADVARAFATDGFFHMLVPREYGGFEVHPRTLVEVIKRVAIGDGSAGWNVMIGATTGLLAASLPEPFARQIYGSAPGAVTVGVTAPLGRARAVDGGYRVSGRWPFGSGSENAGWICGGSFIYDGDVQRMGKAGVPEIHLMMFPAEDVVIEDTWRVSGLCGTGSHHFHVDDAFVPEGRSVVLGGRARIERPLYQFPMLGLLALGVSSVSLGIGYAAVNAFRELAAVKKPTGSQRNLGERPLAQAELARSLADLRSAEAYMLAAIDEAWREAEAGNRLGVELKANLRLAAANTTHRAVDAVDRVYEAAGGTSIYDDNVLQRCFRDVHVSTQHIMVANPVYEVVGRVELGLPPGSLL